MKNNKNSQEKDFEGGDGDSKTKTQDISNCVKTAQLMNDCFGICLGIGVTALSLQLEESYLYREYDWSEGKYKTETVPLYSKAPMIFIGVGMIFLHLLGLVAGFRTWRPINTAGKFLTFRSTNNTAILVFLIMFLAHCFSYNTQWKEESFRNIVLTGLVINIGFLMCLQIILIMKYCQKKPNKNKAKRVKVDSCSKIISDASAPTVEGTYENVDELIKTDL